MKATLIRWEPRFTHGALFRIEGSPIEWVIVY